MGRPKAKQIKKEKIGEVCYEVHEEDMNKLFKMYVGVVKRSGCTNTVQEWLSMQGFFLIKITPLGANKVLMEEVEEGIFPVLMLDARHEVD